MLYGVEPDREKHPDLFAAWFAAKCAAGHAAFIDRLAMIENFADAAQACRATAASATSISDEFAVWNYLKNFYEHHEGLFYAPVDALAAELSAAAGEAVDVCGIYAPSAHAAAVRLLAQRLWTVWRYAPSFEAATIENAWSDIREDLMRLATLANWSRLAVLVEQEHLAVATRRAESAGKETTIPMTVAARAQQAKDSTINAVTVAPLTDSEQAADAAIRDGCRSLKELEKTTGISSATLTNHVIPALKRKRGLLARPYRYP